MNGTSRATNGEAPRLPLLALAAIVLVTPLVAALLDPDPQNLLAEWKESGRSTLALFVFTVVNGSAVFFTSQLVLNALRPRGLWRGWLCCLGVMAVVTPAVVWLPLSAWRLLDARLFGEPVVFMVRALLITAPWISLTWFAAAVWLPTQAAGLRARISALQSRLEPHFLFNALDTLAQLIATEARTAEEMLVRLSELLRELVVLADSPLIPLERELRLVNDYLAVAKLRFSTLHYEVRADEVGALVPPACLLPLVENAVLHGGGRVTVDVSRVGDALVATVRNSRAETSRLTGTHTAMRDLRERLRLAFGERASLETAQNADQWVTELRLPWTNA